MSKFDKLLIKYLIFAIPLVLVIVCWGTMSDPDAMSVSDGISRTLWDILGINFMIWLLGTFYIVLKMVFQKSFRDLILGKFAGVKERDERESIIVGEAAKVSFLSSMAFIILLLFFSIIHVTIAKKTNVADTSDKKGYISIGLNFSVLAEKKVTAEDPKNEIKYIDYSGLPLSGTVILLLIFIWQIGSYKYVMRKEQID